MKKPVMGSPPANNIPDNLWWEILSRLPAKSLLRFRCVSKSWQSLIADPDFHHSHLNSSLNNPHQTQLFITLLDIDHKEEYFFKRYNPLETTALLATAELPTVPKTTTLMNSYFLGRWRIMSFTNGLCLLKEYLSKELMLWNPSIRKFRSVPPSPEISRELRSIDSGLGFDPSTKDYKVVVLLGQFQENRVYSVAVYSVMTDSWKVIQFSGTRCSDWHWSFPRYTYLFGLGMVSFRGYMCFIAKDVHTNKNALVSFDLRREVFGSTHSPNDGSFDYGEKLVVVKGECRWVSYDRRRRKGSIWLLEGCGSEFEAMHWRLLCSFSIETPTLVGSVLRNGDLLLRRDKAVTRYNVETLEEEILVDNRDEKVSVDDVYEYNESMVLL